MERYIVDLIKFTRGELVVNATDREEAKILALTREKLQAVEWQEENIEIAEMTKIPLVCTKCGKEIPDDSIYCNKCGKKI